MILHIITGLGQGGAEASLYRLLRGVSVPQQHHVVSLTNEGIYADKLRDMGVQVSCLRMRSLVTGVAGFLRLLRLMRRLRPKLVQTWLYHADLVGGLASRLAGIPVCWGVRHSNLDPAANKRTTLWVVRWCAWFSRWVPHRIVSCSIRAILVHREFGYADRFSYIPNGLELSAYVPDPQIRNSVRERLGFHSGQRVIGHVGRLHPQKDYPTLLAAFRQLRSETVSVHLLLAGTGLSMENAQFTQLLGAKPQAIVALGSRLDIPQLLQAMDVFALSSVGEAFPNAVAEAMAAGVPCVVTDVGDSAEIVGDTGWVVPASDPMALSAALVSALAESPLVRAARGIAARKRIEQNYTIERMVDAYERVWANAQGR